MQLEALTINGFKSFADKTVIQFADGVTGIVGPNGSGKSNVTEAIRWAMGEQSAKSLRGERMNDVIFAGTDLRHPLNRAEVTLKFDNSDHYLKDDHEHVQITRRVYRNGDSEFLLNQKSCRLKDVVDLFLDSGLGRNSFSIISQGRVEEIFNSKPEDRRIIFEEAAGIAKYKLEKKKAQNELDQTEANLERVHDIVHELEAQVEPLREQSSIAQDYLDQKQDFDRLQKQLLVYQIGDLAKQQSSAQQKNHEITKTLANLTAQAEQSQSEYQVVQEQIDENDQKLSQLNQQLIKKTQLVESLSGKNALNAERMNHFNMLLETTKQDIADTEREIKSLETDNESLSAKLNEKNEFLKTNQVELATLKKVVDEGEAGLQQKIDEIRNDYIDQLQNKTSADNQVTNLQQQLERTSSIHSQATKEQADLLAQQEDVDQELQQKNSTLKESAEALKLKQALLVKNQNDLNDLQANGQALQQKWYEALEILQKSKAKQKSLQELNEDYTGFYQGVRQVLKHKDQISGILGAVAELIQVPQKYQTAFEMALGAQLQNVVAADQNAAQAGIQYLKQNHSGRATFLPISVMKPRILPQATKNLLQSAEGFVGIASDLIKYDQKIDPVISYLMGQLILATDLTHGVKIANLVGHRYRVVTLDGDILNPGGAMTGGATKVHQQNILSRPQEIEQLTEQINTMQATLDEKQAVIEAKRNEYKALKATIDNDQPLIANEEERLRDLKNTISILQERSSSIKRRLQAQNYSKEQEDQAKLQLEEELKQQLLVQEQSAKAIENAQSELAIAQKQLAEFNSNQKEVSEQVQAKETNVAIAKREVEYAKSNLQQNESSLATLQTKLSQLKSNFESTTQQLAQNQSTKQDQKVSLKEEQKNIESLNQELVEAQQSKEQLTLQLQAKFNERERAQELQNRALEEREENAVLLNRIKIHLQQNLTQLSDDYELTFELAKKEISLDSFNEAQVKQQIKLLSRGIKELGHVNLDAIEQFKQVQTRYDFLKQQQDDLIAAREKLVETAEKMDQQAAIQFKTVFDQINEAFQDIFPKMFGGGHASLALTNEEDLLASGVEIAAQPPGKTLQKLSLLSGGERALTAITLLFAMIKVKPVPFVILDEVEASLDDANVLRFSRFLKNYEASTQFIVITHRKGTMMQADALYGVTMEESGISKVISLAIQE